MCVVPLPYQVCAKCLAISQLVRSCDTSSVPHSWPHLHYKFHLLFVKAELSMRSFLPCLGMLDVPLISRRKADGDVSTCRPAAHWLFCSAAAALVDR